MCLVHHFHKTRGYSDSIPHEHPLTLVRRLFHSPPSVVHPLHPLIVGPTGGYCIDLMNLERDAGKDNSNGNAHLDPVLCDLIASTVGRGSSTLVDLGAGVGHYGECLKSKGYGTMDFIIYDS